MNNNTKKAIMLGALLLGCGATGLLGSVMGNNNETTSIIPRVRVEQSTKNEKLNPEEISTKALIKVYISGAVAQPGIYNLPKGARADEAIALAGGMLEVANPQRVNLALILKDGMQVNVPYLKGYDKKLKLQQEHSVYGNANQLKKIQTKGNNAIVNLNRATVQELTSLPGIGSAMAQRIIDYRRLHTFSRIEDLTKVPGIGKAKLEKLRSRLSV